MISRARYDEAAELYVAEVGDRVSDEATSGLLELTGDVRGQRVLDIACGQGRITRELQRRGAEVTGVDLSRALIEQAREQESSEPLGIRYHVLDVVGLRPPEFDAFDAVVCNFGLSDIDDLDGAYAAVYRILRPLGRMVFSILHPCFPGWGPGRSSSWAPGTGYYTEGWWRTQEPASRIRRAVGANHWMISTYVNSMTRHGLIMDQLLEPLPPRAWLVADPTFEAVPTYLVARVRRSDGSAGLSSTTT